MSNLLNEFRSTYITWDKATRRIYSPVTANESDENGRKLVVQIVNGGQVEDLTGASLHLYWETRDKLHDGLDVFKSIDLKKGEFELSYTTGMLSNKGVLNANLVLVDTVGRIVSERFKITVTEGIDNDAIQSENSFSSLTQALIDVSNLEQNYAPRLNDLTAQLQQTEQELSSQLAHKPTYDEVRQDTATRPINVSEMDTETKQLFTGGSVAVVGENAVGNENLKPKSVSLEKTDDLLQTSLSQIYNGKKLFKGMVTEPVFGTTTNAYGWANQMTYKGEKITGVRVFVPVSIATGKLKMSIRLGSNINVVLAESNEKDATHSGYYTFVFSKTIDNSIITEPSFYITIESVGQATYIRNSGLTGTTSVTDRVLLGGFYQLTASGSWYKLNSNLSASMDVEFLGLLNLDEKVDNDGEYQLLKETVQYSQTANKLFSSRTDEINLSAYVSSFFGWATPLTYKGEEITSSRIFLNMDTFKGDVISKILDENMAVIATSFHVKPTKNGWYDFAYDKRVTSKILTGGTFYLTVESVGRVDRILEPSSVNPIGENRLVNGAQYKYLNSSGNWVNVSTTPKYALYATLYNNNVSQAIDKVTNPNSENVSIVSFPNRFYTVANDVDYDSPTERHYTLPLYSEYLANHYHDLRFSNGEDKRYLVEEIGSSNVTTKPLKIGFNKGEYTADPVNTNQIITKASTPNKKAFVLTIGDSVTEGANSSNRQYWKQANELFEKEAIDFGRDNTVNFIGRAQKRHETAIDYKGVQKTIYSSAEGRSGWDGLSYLRYSTVRRPSQETWDALGLGDGTKTDYKGTPEQKKLIQNTNEVNATDSPNNPFFDNDKTGTNRFSIAKWLERYRTLDDNGNRLTLGNGTGTKITADNLETIDVCTPTHVVLAFGHNDIAYQGIEAFQVYMKEWIAEIRAQLPNAHIFLVLSIPRIGLWNNKKYPNYQGVSSPYNLDKYIDNADNWISYFDSYDEVANNTFLLPQFFVTPSAESYKTIEHVDASGDKAYRVIGDDLHPGYKAHANWGYQLYALLKYTMTL